MRIVVTAEIATGTAIDVKVPRDKVYLMHGHIRAGANFGFQRAPGPRRTVTFAASGGRMWYLLDDGLWTIDSLTAPSTIQVIDVTDVVDLVQALALRFAPQDHVET